jgi:hypothetical protein
MNDDIVLEFLEKLSKNLDNIKVDYDSDQVIFQEPGNPYKFVYYKKSMYPYKGERIKVYVYENDQKLYEYNVDGQQMYKLAEKVLFIKVNVLKNYINNFLKS